MRAAMRMLAGGVVLLTACQEVSGPADTSSREPVNTVSVDQVALSRQLPSFGGMFLDESGRPNVYVTDMRDESRIRARLAAFALEHGFDAADIQVLRGEFSFARLNDAFERATHAAMPLAGSVFTDLDEARNRIVVGVERAAQVQGARAALARAGLDDGSYEVIVTEPIHQVATLRDRFDPTVGGIQIHFSQYVCTLGANVTSATGQRSFLTNSHCTAKQGGVENTVYYQPASSVDGTVIATEVADPTYFRNGACPKGKQCRYSDSSRAQYSASRASTLGAMAITGSVNSGSLTVTGTRSIAGKGTVVTGTTVNKVGRTTGWTQAAVSRTCVNTGVSGSNIMQLCQHWVQSNNATIVAGGDSGSTVWTGSTSITIVGLLWGGSSDNRTFIFSPIGQVEQELGTLTFN